MFEIGSDPDVVLGVSASHVSLGVTLGLALLVIGIGVLTAFAVWIAAHTARTTRRKAES